MPIYEYKCQKCGDVFDELMRFNDPDPPCTGCGSDEVQKLMSNTSFQLKGTGWYVTDYKTGSGSSASSSSSDEPGLNGSDSNKNGDKTDKGKKTDTDSASKTTSVSESKSKSTSSEPASAA